MRLFFEVESVLDSPSNIFHVVPRHMKPIARKKKVEFVVHPALHLAIALKLMMNVSFSVLAVSLEINLIHVFLVYIPYFILCREEKW